MKKILLIIFVILVIGMLVKFALKLKQANGPEPSTTPNPQTVDTSGWETYKIDDVGFSVMNPQNSRVFSTQSGVSIYLDDYLGVSETLKLDFGELIRQERGQPINFIGLSFTFVSLENPENYEIADWLKFYRDDIYNAANSKQPVEFKDIKAFKLEREDRGLGNGLYAYRESTVYFFHNDRLFSIRSIAPPTNPSDAWLAHPYYPYLEASVPITEAIINSFKFVE